MVRLFRILRPRFADAGAGDGEKETPVPTTFTVFSLGTQPIWDPTEGDQNLSVTAVNQTLGEYGSAGNPLFNATQTLSPAGNGFSGGSSTSYDLDNTVTNDQFSIDGGPPQTMDAAMVVDAVVTYKNGDTATIMAVIFQDANGATYWAPEITANADHDAIEAAAIQSLELVSPIYAQGAQGRGYGLTANRQVSDLICFAAGAGISCPSGERPVETLAAAPGPWYEPDRRQPASRPAARRSGRRCRGPLRNRSGR